jgi:hypothetical protein
MITFDRLQQIIPADQALANKALSVALTQINGLSFIGLPAFGAAVKNLETTQSLPKLTALKQAVPPAVANTIVSLLAVGKGVNGNIQLVNILGLAGGWIATPNFLKTVELFGTMDLSTLTLIYLQMASAANGDFGPIDSGPIVIPSGPAAGTYLGVEVAPGPPPEYDPTALAVAFSSLRAAALAEIANLQATYPEQTTELNVLWAEMAEQVQLEKDLQDLAKINWGDLTEDDRVSIYGLVYSLPDYGVDNREGGVSWLLEKMAAIGTLGGEAIIGCLREGRNQVALNNTGIYTNSKVPGEPIPPPPEAELLPSVYTENEAINLVTR